MLVLAIGGLGYSLGGTLGNKVRLVYTSAVVNVWLSLRSTSSLLDCLLNFDFVLRYSIETAEFLGRTVVRFGHGHIRTGRFELVEINTNAVLD